ncbi:MAG: 6-pyruvoyl-tetrahydropterin synthase-related protein [Terriglobales bacterium]
MIHLVVLASLCGLAVMPFFSWGNPSGHDFEFHMYSWMEVLAQWQQGIVYPRWAALAHWGYGEARFLFYPPSSWMVGAALGAILPWKIVPGTYCWIVLTGAGASMYALARQWLRRSDALFAAAFYAVNPYHLLIVYWRSAYAELLGAILMPLSLLCLLKLKQDGSRPILWLSLTLAGAWLANVPAAVMIHYSVAGLAGVMAVQERSARLLFRTALAVLMGAGLASFFLVPAIYEQSWVNIAELLSPGVMPQDNFLFTMTANADHNRFNLLVSLVASSEIAALVLVAWLARRSENKNNGEDRGNRLRIEGNRFNEDRLDRLPWTLLACWGAATAFVMFPISNVLWEHLPKFRFVQLPFRWLLCLNASMAVLLAVATRQSWPRSAVKAWSARAVACAFLLTVLLMAGHRVQPPWWDQSGDIQEMTDAISDQTGYEGTDEYVPVAADPYEVNKDLRQVSDENGSPINVRKMEWGANEKRFDMHADLPENLTMRLFNYPAWKVTVNGKPTQTQTSEVTGLMIIPVKAGENEVRVSFTRTGDCLAGEIISVMSLCVFWVVWIKTRSHRAGRRAV